jgi:hypothetical protein
MILHEPRVDEYFLPFSVVLSTKVVVLFTNHLLFYYSSPKTSEDPHEFIMKLNSYYLMNWIIQRTIQVLLFRVKNMTMIFMFQ